MSAEPPVLQTIGLGVRYGGVRANDDVSLTVRAGTIAGLIGPNGAGKTTFVDAVTGFAASTGQVLLDGQHIEHLSPHRRAQLGLRRTWQSVELFHDLTVRDNLRVTVERTGWRAALADMVRPGRRTTAAAVDDVLALLDLEALADRRPGQLSLGLQKLVGVARALAERPRLVLLDEAAAGLDSAESRDLGQRIRAVAAAGISVLLIDHDMDLVLATSHEVHVLDVGRLIASGTPDEVRNDPAVLAAYLGAAT